ncbi:alpha/beta hydrolase [Methylocapsa polymorpha]|uniref:Alpha/beta hydrolase n=1 Tax=Methylocapsa polymorpha TaxID=3080828 RepID=A0ABZ0HWM1_9HYPH|nr:alpha/beta hydrolase [Methylocapsa sp. RX1]
MAIGLWVALCGLGLLAVAATYLAYCKDIDAIRAKVRAGGRLAQTSAGLIEYASDEHVSDRLGPPALIIHGASGGYDQGISIGKQNFGDAFQIVAPSRFGYLRTPLPRDGSPAAQADAHAALLDCLNLDRVVALGFSMGARSAVELALRHPHRVSALILESPIAYAPSDGPKIDYPGSRRLIRLVTNGADFIYWLLLRIAPNFVIRLSGMRPELVARATEIERDKVMAVIRGVQPLSLRLAGVSNDLASLIAPWPLDKIAAPTFIVAAADDLFNTLPAARYAAAGIFRATLLGLDSGGHLFVGRHDEIRAKLAAFLKKAGVMEQAT